MFSFSKHPTTVMSYRLVEELRIRAARNIAPCLKQERVIVLVGHSFPGDQCDVDFSVGFDLPPQEGTLLSSPTHAAYKVVRAVPSSSPRSVEALVLRLLLNHTASIIFVICINIPQIIDELPGFTEYERLLSNYCDLLGDEDMIRRGILFFLHGSTPKFKQGATQQLAQILEKFQTKDNDIMKLHRCFLDSLSSQTVLFDNKDLLQMLDQLSPTPTQLFRLHDKNQEQEDKDLRNYLEATRDGTYPLLQAVSARRVWKSLTMESSAPRNFDLTALNLSIPFITMDRPFPTLEFIPDFHEPHDDALFRKQISWCHVIPVVVMKSSLLEGPGDGLFEFLQLLVENHLSSATCPSTLYIFEVLTKTSNDALAKSILRCVEERRSRGTTVGEEAWPHFTDSSGQQEYLDHQMSTFLETEALRIVNLLEKNSKRVILSSPSNMMAKTSEGLRGLVPNHHVLLYLDHLSESLEKPRIDILPTEITIVDALSLVEQEGPDSSFTRYFTQAYLGCLHTYFDSIAQCHQFKLSEQLLGLLDDLYTGHASLSSSMIESLRSHFEQFLDSITQSSFLAFINQLFAQTVDHLIPNTIDPFCTALASIRMLHLLLSLGGSPPLEILNNFQIQLYHQLECLFTENAERSEQCAHVVHALGALVNTESFVEHLCDIAIERTGRLIKPHTEADIALVALWDSRSFPLPRVSRVVKEMLSYLRKIHSHVTTPAHMSQSNRSKPEAFAASTEIRLFSCNRWMRFPAPENFHDLENIAHRLLMQEGEAHLALHLHYYDGNDFIRFSTQREYVFAFSYGRASGFLKVWDKVCPASTAVNPKSASSSSRPAVLPDAEPPAEDCSNLTPTSEKTISKQPTPSTSPLIYPGQEAKNYNLRPDVRGNSTSPDSTDLPAVNSNCLGANPDLPYSTENKENNACHAFRNAQNSSVNPNNSSKSNYPNQTKPDLTNEVP